MPPTVEAPTEVTSTPVGEVLVKVVAELAPAANKLTALATAQVSFLKSIIFPFNEIFEKTLLHLFS
jgi:hypothetical protein